MNTCEDGSCSRCRRRKARNSSPCIGWTLGEPLLALRTYRRPAMSSTSLHCRSHVRSSVPPRCVSHRTVEFRPRLAASSSEALAPAAQRGGDFARCAPTWWLRAPRKNDRYGSGCRLCSRCCNVTIFRSDPNKARNVQTLPERRHKCSAPASDELRKNPIIGIVWLLRPGLRRCDPRYLNEVRFTPWLSLWRSSRKILNHGCKSLRSDFHRAGERMIDDHNGQQPGKDQD